MWTLTLDGQSQTMETAAGAVPLGGKDWSCGYAIEPVEAQDGEQGQWGTLDCQHRRSGRAVATQAFCMATPSKPSDCANTNLSLEAPGETGHQVTLSCRSAGDACQSADLEIADGGASLSSDARFAGAWMKPGSSGSFHWQLELHTPGEAGVRVPLDQAQNGVPVGLEGWSCVHRVGTVTASNYPHAELASLRCEADGIAFAMDLPCVSAGPEAPACLMAPFQVAEGNQERSLLLACESQGHPSCL